MFFGFASNSMKLKKKEKTLKKPIEITETIEKRSFALLRFIGYIILIFSVVDYLAILIPPRLTDPDWEFQTLRQLVDHVWSPLLGLTFLFLYSQASVVSSRQLSILRFFSLSALIIGIVYLLMLPLGVNNSLTLYRVINAQFANQQAQQQEQLEQVNSKLNATNSPAVLNNIARSLNLQKEGEPSKSPQELKNQISQQIKTVTQNALTTANVAKRQQVKNLIKEAVRINLGTVISGVCFVTFWRLTRWTRMVEKNVE